MNATLPDAGTLESLMLRDARRLSGKLARLARLARDPAAAAPLAREVERLAVEASARASARRAHFPKPEFPDDLPIAQRRDDIAALIAKHPVTIVCGETGSGKTTQIPKICLNVGRGARGLIGCTQPRRIAARSLAKRLAFELRGAPAHSVGYKVRFHDRTHPDGYIKVMTDGILLAEVQSDPELLAYDTLIIDEAHERGLNIDFLLGYVKHLLAKRTDLKVVITSATIDTEKFSKHFDNAPVIEVSGRTYPVEVRYRDYAVRDETDDDDDAPSSALYRNIVRAVDELSSEGKRGDVLVFLPGEREIREAAEALRRHHPKGVEIFPLFARLSAEEQDRVFTPSAARRIVLATNVAETSLTVPGIRYVIDSGLVRMNRYSPRSKVNLLQIEANSKASARQRAGRCGRVAEGVCIRLYDEAAFEARPDYTTPELLRTSLASVILRMKALGLPDIEAFAFVDPPFPKMVADGYQLLTELGALDHTRRLTKIGESLATLPIDPKLGRILLAARELNCLDEALVIAAFLSINDPRERPMDAREAADGAHARFADEASDFVAVLNLWKWFDEALRHKKSNRKLAEQCRDSFLSYFRLKEWRDVHAELARLMAELHASANKDPANYETLHKALLTGFLGNVGMKDPEEDAYRAPRGVRFVVAPGTPLKTAKPRWLTAAELTETTRLYARTVAKIEPEWIEAQGRHLVKRTHFEPHWDERTARVMAYEQVSLHGLIIVAKRAVHYGPINPHEARDIFIREALVNERYESRGAYFRHNRQLRRDIEAIEAKARKQDVLADDSVVFDFFNARVPEGIHNGAAFEHWRKQAEAQDAHVLFLTRDVLMRRLAGEVTPELYPDRIALGQVSYALKYRFDPGHPRDGVSLILPVAALNQVPAGRLDWLVPGLLREKVTAYLKALPQSLRRTLVPLPDTVSEFIAWVEAKSGAGKWWRDEPLVLTLAAFLKQTKRLDVPREAWDALKLPAHLQLNLRLIDDDKRDVDEGRDIEALRVKHGAAAREAMLARKPSGALKSGLISWEVGTLPAFMPVVDRGVELKAYPALVDHATSVALELFDDEERASRAHREGVLRLAHLAMADLIRQIEKDLKPTPAALLQFANLKPLPERHGKKATIEHRPTPEDFKHEITRAALIATVLGDAPLPRDQAAFTARVKAARTELTTTARNVFELAQAALARMAEINSRIERLHIGAFVDHVDDIRTQLAWLMHAHFIDETPLDVLAEYPRYLQAIVARLDALPRATARFSANLLDFRPLWQNLINAPDRSHAEVRAYRWMLEELRVSLFAEALGTKYPVSIKRAIKQWQALKEKELHAIA